MFLWSKGEDFNDRDPRRKALRERTRFAISGEKEKVYGSFWVVGKKDKDRMEN
jgi:hypothetical protein